MEITAIQYAEAGDFEKAITTLDEAILLVPERASLYNNRAQVNQLRGHFDGRLMSYIHRHVCICLSKYYIVTASLNNYYIIP